MKKHAFLLLLVTALTACSTSYNQAKLNANKVQNGMTLQEVITTLGMEPSVANSEYAYWRRGRVQEYTGTMEGSIRFNFKDGRVVDVPDGGIFSPAALAKIKAARDAVRRKAEEEQAAKNAAIASALLEEANLERIAAASAVIPCHDKLTCSKVFALAQIYVAHKADQKIQVATDTIIQTYNPTETGNIGISIIKTPRSGTTEIVSISATCKEDDRTVLKPGSICHEKRTSIYGGFRPFVESQLAK